MSLPLTGLTFSFLFYIIVGRQTLMLFSVCADG